MPTAEGNINQKVWADIKRWFGHSLRIVIPMACSALLICWLFHKVNVRDVIAAVRHNVDFWWLGLMLVFNFCSYIVRGTRWGIQLGGVGIHVRQPSLWVSIFGAYSLNLVFTGLGETWRCLFISHQKKAPLSTVIGTDLGDRITDLAAVLVILLLTFIFASHSISDFITHYGVSRDMHRIFDNPWVLGGTAAAIVIFWAIGHFYKSYKLIDAIDQCFDNIWQGFKALKTMHHKGKFLLLTLALWICYFMQTYICFFAFPFTRDLITPENAYGLLPGLVVLMFGSMSMAIPSSGGLGPWNIAVIFSLSLYGVSQTDGTAFSMLVWGLEAILQVCLGIFSAIYVGRLKPDCAAPAAAY